MLNRNSGFKCQSYDYDVFRDGGSQIQHLSGLFLPANAQIILGLIKVITTFTDNGAGAQVGIGIPGFIGFILPTQPIAAFTAGVLLTTFTPPPLVAGVEVTTDVINDDLVTGRFILSFWYNEFSE